MSDATKDGIMNACLSRAKKAGILLPVALLSLLSACGGGASSNSPIVPPAAKYTAESGVAQKGPLIKGSAVTAQELDSTLSPTGKQYSYQTTSDFGAFSPTNTFASQYIGVNATGYYFDEVQNAVSSGPITLYGYSNLATDTVLNVNLLTTLEYQRIQTLVTKSNMTFADARTQAEREVLAALNIPAGSYGPFSTLDLSGTSDGDHILAAISGIFVYGNSAGPLSQLIDNFQSDIGANGAITNPKTTAALVAAAGAINPASIAANLTQEYSSEGLTFTASNISDWIAQSGDGVIGKFAFQVPDATPSTIFTFPASVVTQFAGSPVSVTAGKLSVNGTPTSGTVSFNSGDVVTLSPGPGAFPNELLTSYLVSGSTKLSRVSFVSDLVSIEVIPNSPSIPKGLTQQFTATGTFSDTSTANLTSSVSWTSGTPVSATINGSSGLANALAAGSTLITATSGSVSGSTTLTVTPAKLESIAITPSPATVVVGIVGTTTQLTATGTYSDGTTQNVTTAANWTVDTLSLATVGPTTGVVTGVSPGSANVSAAIGSVTATTPLSVVTNAWVLTGSMSTVRLNHTATLLPNGKVLAVGGGASTLSGTSSAEIYNPASGTWTLTGSLNLARTDHSATLLPNGTVLVTGGYNGSALSSAEIYNPSTGIWTLTGSMSTTRWFHTATLLPDGTVLVVGGSGAANDTTDLASAEIFNPTTGTWTLTGSMSTARYRHTATLLPNGTVLVAGGDDDSLSNGGPAVASAEIFNPATGTWTLTGSMSMARYDHTATLLANGTAMVTGGGAGNGFATILASTEIYDPVAGTWSVTSSLTTARFAHTATLLPNGRVLVAGGSGELSSAEIYDPVAAAWTVTGSLNWGRESHTATLLPNGTVLAAGGGVMPNPEPPFVPPTNQASAEYYDPASGL
jgi:Bacterial Ig-like domain (group 2)/Galactose oxidase, central domain/Kelch motif